MLNIALALLAAIPAPVTAALPAAPGALHPAPLAVDDGHDEDVPDKREEIKQLIAQMAGHVKKRGAEDAEAIAVIEQLYEEFPNCGPKDRKAIVKGLGKNLGAKRPQKRDGTYENRLYIATAVSLADMGPESVKVLQGEIGAKPHKRNLELQRRLILSLGKTKDPSAVKTLTKILPHQDETLQAAAAEALGEFSDADQKVRKQIFDDILKQLAGAKTDIDNDPTDPIVRDRYEAISGPMISTLQQLSGEDLRDPEVWQRWWNKNKKADWDK